MVSVDWISWETITTLIIRAIHLMEWKAVLSCNAFLLSKFLICMQSLFRIAVLSTVSHIEILPRPFIEKMRKKEKAKAEIAKEICAIWPWCISSREIFKRIKIAITQSCMIVKMSVTFIRLQQRIKRIYFAFSHGIFKSSKSQHALIANVIR